MQDGEILRNVVQRLQAELGDDLKGVLAGGSRLRGEADANSDIDVVVVIGEPKRRRQNLTIDGVEVEMFVNPAFQMRRYFEQDRNNGRGLMPHLCLTGTVLFDPYGIVAKLQQEAREIWEAGPAPLTPREIWEYRYHTIDALLDIDDVKARDPASAGLLVSSLLPALIDRHYRISGRWLRKRKHLLNDLSKWDSLAAGHARRASETGSDIGHRHGAMVALAEHVLAPIGGRLPPEWSLDWEPLSADGKAS
jgi:predicted nucleotidyltransferase